MFLFLRNCLTLRLNSKGLSLIELMISLVIIVVVALGGAGLIKQVVQVSKKARIVRAGIDLESQFLAALSDWENYNKSDSTGRLISERLRSNEQPAISLMSDSLGGVLGVPPYILNPTELGPTELCKAESRQDSGGDQGHIELGKIVSCSSDLWVVKLRAVYKLINSVTDTHLSYGVAYQVEMRIPQEQTAPLGAAKSDFSDANDFTLAAIPYDNVYGSVLQEDFKCTKEKADLGQCLLNDSLAGQCESVHYQNGQTVPGQNI